jgi:hypothetical protein
MYGIEALTDRNRDENIPASLQVVGGHITPLTDDDYYSDDDEADCGFEETEPESKEPAPVAAVPVLRYINIALIVLAILVQCGLVRQCTHVGNSGLYCTLEN